MGKKINHTSRKKGDNKELQPVTRNSTIHLHKLLHKCTFKKKAPTAVKVIREHAKKTMFTDDVRIDTELNQALWKNGIRNVDRRVQVTMERKKNEEEEEGNQQFYTLVRLAK